MNAKKLIEKANELYLLTQEIKERTEKAEKIKAEIRAEIPKDGLQVNDEIIIKKVVQVNPVLDLNKLYKQMTFKELVACTKPVLGELKKAFPDGYDDLIERFTTIVETKECVKFFPVKK